MVCFSKASWPTALQLFCSVNSCFVLSTVVLFCQQLFCSVNSCFVLLTASYSIVKHELSGPFCQSLFFGEGEGAEEGI